MSPIVLAIALIVLMVMSFVVGWLSRIRHEVKHGVKDSQTLDSISRMVAKAFEYSNGLTDPLLRERVINACAEYKAFIESVIEHHNKK